MKYFYDCEFLEGTQKTWTGVSLPTIDLISIGIVSEDDRKYYAISKDFNLKEAWNRYDLKEVKCHAGDVIHVDKDIVFRKDSNTLVKKSYWIRENVLKPIEMDLFKLHCKANVGHDGIEGKGDYKAFKWMLNKYGKSNKQIAEEIKEFTNVIEKEYPEKCLCGERDTCYQCQEVSEYNNNLDDNIKFYGYYSAYDHVALCWLFGKMIDLPAGFPMYTIDLKQTLDEKVEQHLDR